MRKGRGYWALEAFGGGGGLTCGFAGKFAGIILEGASNRSGLVSGLAGFWADGTLGLGGAGEMRGFFAALRMTGLASLAIDYLSARKRVSISCQLRTRV